MPLTPAQVALLERHRAQYDANQPADAINLGYRDGEQVIEQLGMAVPPEYRRFLVIAGWPGVAIDAWSSRSNLRDVSVPGDEAASGRLRAIWAANDADYQTSMMIDDRYTFGRSFISIGSNEEDPGTPLVRVESPRQMTALIDGRLGRLTSAAKWYAHDPSDGLPRQVALYERNLTTHLSMEDGRWSVTGQAPHRLGRVPIIMTLYGNRAGEWTWRSAMDPLKGITDSCARALTNMQFASEAHGIPQRWVLGVGKDDFVDKDGNPIPRWQAYFNSVWANANPEVKVGQFSASDLTNFETQISLYGKLASSVSGLPSRYFGLQTTNPPSAEAIKAEESQTVHFVERQNMHLRTVLGWAGSLALRFATGEWHQVRADFHDPSTSTVAQLEDALMKRRTQGVLSREGYWDELGWDEDRKTKERAWLAAEASDPLSLALESLMGNSGGVAAG